MELVLLVFFLLVVALIIVLVVEIREYRLYRKAATAVIAFGESMQVSFSQVAEQINRQTVQQNMIGRGLLVTQQEVEFLEAVSRLHSEALNLNTKSLRDRHSKLEADTGGEDEPTEI
jgi:intergrase/recombinase